MQILLLIFLYLTIIISPSHATPSKPSSYKFRHYSLSEGLSQGTVTSLAQDKDGFIWIGTQDGLNRFDGYHFKIYQHEINNPKSLKSNYITELHVDDAGNLWVGTTNGLYKFVKQNNTFIRYELSTDNIDKSQYINIIINGPNNNLWVGSNSGLYLLNPATQQSESFENIFKNTSVSQNGQVNALLIDKQNQLWIGNSYGVSILNPITKELKKSKIVLNQKGALQGDYITDIVQDKKGDIWVSTYHSGLIKISQDTFKIYKYDSKNLNSISHNRVRSLLIDNYGALWVGTAKGVNIYDPASDNFTRYTNNPANPSSLSSDYIWEMIQDNNDSVWLGTSNGINQFIQSTLLFGHNNNVQTNLGLSHKHVRSFYKTSNNTLWIGVDNGLNKYDPIEQVFTHYTNDPQDDSSISPGMIMSVFKDSNDRVWSGSYNNGLSLLIEPNKFKHYTHIENNSNSLSHNRVYSITEGTDGYLWIGTLNGLNRFDPKTNTFKHYFNEPNNLNSLSDNSIYAILPTSNGLLWIATRNGGVNLFDPKTNNFKRFMHDINNVHSLSNNKVFALYLQNDTYLWAGTSNGLNKLNIKTNQITRYQRHNGLLNNNIYAVTGDQNNNIWFSSNRGLTRYEQTTEQFKHFDKEYGLQSNEFNNGSFYKAHDNELFFGGINGFNRFYPSSIKSNRIKPKVEITEFYLANKTTALLSQPRNKSLNQSITLNYKQSVFSIEFTALHFTDPKRNKFSYILEGFDEAWTDTNAENRRATYTNLPPGDYYFKVKAANRDGIWGEHSKPIHIKITPAPWNTIWAFILYFFLLSAILGAFFLQRYRKQQAITISEKRLSLSLWASGNEFWDYNAKTKNLIRSSNKQVFNLPTGKNITIESMKPQVHPEDFKQLELAYIKHLNNDSDYFECTYRLRNELNQWVWVLDRGKVINRDKNGNAVRVLGTIQNINEIKTIEEKLRKLNEQLESRVEQRTSELTLTVEELATTIQQLTNTQLQLAKAEKMAALGNLVNGISHEINTPVGICITSSSVLQSIMNDFFSLQSENQLTRELFEDFKHSSLDSLELISRNLERTALLVKSFKMVAVEQTEAFIEKKNIKEVIKFIINSFGPQLNDNQAVINLNCDNDISISCTFSSFELVMSQLIQNSLLHGAIKNQNLQIDITVTLENQHIIIQFKDNGVGLNNTKVVQVFEPFYTTLRSEGNVGLGMHIVYNHVTQRLNGCIEIDESHTLGLAYVIMLPLIKFDNI